LCGRRKPPLEKKWCGSTAGLSIAERMAWFRRQSSVPAIRDQAQPVEEESVLREEPPTTGKSKIMKETNDTGGDDSTG